MTDEFKRGLVTGLAMRPLAVVPFGDRLPRPVIELFFDGNLDNTGTGEFDIAAVGDILYADGAEGQCYNASSATEIRINGCTELLSGDLTICFWFRITAASGLAPYPLFRRCVWWVANGAYWGTELGYSNNVSNNKFALVANGTSSVLSDTAYNDGAWHFAAITRSSNFITAAVDGLEILSIAAPTQSVGDTITISSSNYALNGYIDSLRVYDTALSLADIAAVMALK